MKRVTQWTLARHLRGGSGDEAPDVAAAFAPFTAAATQDYPDAILSFGTYYANGFGIVQDYARAAALYDRVYTHTDSSHARGLASPLPPPGLNPGDSLIARALAMRV